MDYWSCVNDVLIPKVNSSSNKKKSDSKIVISEKTIFRVTPAKSVMNLKKLYKR